MTEEQQSTLNENEPAMSPSGSASGSGGTSNKMLVGGIVVVVIIVIIAMAAWLTNTEAAVAVVNGEEISQKEYDLHLRSLEQVYRAQGQEVSDAQRKQLLDSMIDRTLILQYARENGITITDEQIEEEYEQFKAQFNQEDGYEAFLTENSLTDEQFRDDVETQLIVQTVLDTQLEAAGIDQVSDAQIEARYNELVAGGEGQDVPALEEVAPQVRAQIQQEWQSRVFTSFVTELREDAEIEVLI
ncbi:MAG: SurA N-terminal domain-containing protein [Candidatus Paceibacterota bacterium]